MHFLRFHLIKWEIGCFIAGGCFVLSLAPFEHHFFSPISFLILLFSLLNTTLFRCFLRAYLFGLGQFLFGISWVYVSIHQYGGANEFTSALLTFSLAAFLSLFPGLFGYLMGRVRLKYSKVRAIFIFPAFWILVEYIRGELILGGFPWLNVGYSALNTILAGYIPIMGLYGTGFLLCLMVSIICLPVIKRHKYSAFFSVTAFLVINLAGFLLQDHQWTQQTGGPIKIALLQGNIDQNKKWLPEYRKKILEFYRHETRQHLGDKIIIWPETSVPAFYDQVKENYLMPLEQEAKQNNTDLIVSLPIRGNSQDEYYNAVITLGSSQGIYRKKRLLPFGEYLPLQPLSGFLLKLMDIPLGDFTEGKRDQALLKALGYPFSTSICYEAAYGDHHIHDLPEAAFLVNVANDGWFINSIEPYQHLQIASMRAIETGRYLARATNTGISGIVSPKGEILNKLPMYQRGVMSGEIFPMGGTTPYARIGNAGVILCVIIWLVLIMLQKKNLSS